MAKVKGLVDVKTGFNKAFKDIKDKKAAKAIYTALTMLDQEQALIVPIGKTANLANNRTLKVWEFFGSVQGRIEFLADYAAAVHSMPHVKDIGPTRINWTRPTAKEQWLETAGDLAKPGIDEVMKRLMKV